MTDHFSNDIDSVEEHAILVRRPEVASRPAGHDAPWTGASQPADEEESGELLEYWQILRRHKKKIALFTIGGAVLGILISLPQKAVWRARTSLEVQSLNEDFLNMRSSNPVTNNDTSNDTSELQTESKLLEGDALMERVIAKLDDAPRPKRQASSGFDLLRTLHLRPDPRTPKQRLLDKASKTLKVRATPRTRIVEINIDSTDPHVAVDMANTLASEFIDESGENRWQMQHKTGQWLGRELEDARLSMQSSEAALQKYAGESGLIFTDEEETNIATEKLQQVQEQLSQITAERIQKQSAYELAQHSAPESLPDVLNDSGLREEASRISDLERQVADLSASFTPQYPKVKRAQAQLDTLKQSFAKDRAAVVERIRNEYEQAARREQLIVSEYHKQKREVTDQGEKAVQYNILKRQAESARLLYDAMLQEMKQASVASALGAGKVRVVDPAEIPSTPIWPDYKIAGGIGLAAGLFIGMIFVLVRERTNRTLQQPGELQYWTTLPELGTVPSAAFGRKQFVPIRGNGKRRLLGGVPGSAPIVDGGPPLNKDSVELIAWQNKPSMFAEAFRSILTSIMFVGENGSRPRLLVFTSPGPGEGKTTVVSNLAIAMAEIQTSVLMVDADIRNPRLHTLFDLPNDRGLSTLLGPQAGPEDTPESLIQPTSIPGLYVLPSGPSTHAAANLLHSRELARILSKLKKQYGMVLIDTPPMLHLTDARIVGRLADGVVLVARSEKTTRDAVVLAKQRFAEDRTRVLGVIFNDWNPATSSYSAYDHRAYLATTASYGGSLN